MKIATKIIILMFAVFVIYGCQENGNNVNLGNGADNSETIPGGGDNGNGGDGETEVDPDNPENPDQELPEIADNIDDGVVETETIDSGKSKMAGNGSYISSGKIGFNDINLGSDISKPIDINTTGKIPANISFMQSHNIAQNGNSINSKPELVAHKDALILVTTGTFYKSMEAVVVTGSKTAVVKLDPPHQIPEVDSTRPDKSGVAFSNRAWSGLIPAKYMKNGIKITINAVNGNNVTITDTLKNEKIDFESPIEATVFVTRIGLLEDVSAYTSTDNYLLSNTAKALSEYFQTVPLAKIIYSKYDNVRISKAMKSNGEVITSINNNTSDYDDIILNQLGAGIQLANKGVAHSDINASAYRDRDPLYIVLNQTATSRTPVTDNKGIISIYNTSGSQFSRFMGYTYGLTDNVDLDKGVVDGSVHNYNTGWGYDSYKNRMRGNLAWNDNGSAIEFEDKTIAGFQNTYGWQKDPMSMGEALDNSTISKYPYHTARAADSIQASAGKRYMLNDAKANGKHHYLYWDRKDDVYKYVTDEKFLAERISPTEKGVPVYTIIGLYNKTNSSQGIIYPALQANYGNVYGDLFVTTKPSGYVLEITYKNGSRKYVNLAVNDSSKLRRFHVNIPQSDKPEKVTLFINGLTNSSITINNNNISEETVIIGKGNGYEKTIDSDIEELQTILRNYNADNFIINDRAEEIISTLNFNNRIDNITDYNTLSIVKKFNDSRKNLDTLKIFIEENRTNLNNGDNDTVEALKAKAVELGYDVPATMVYIGQQIKMKQRAQYCFEPQMVGGKMQAKEVDCVDNKTEQLWYMDADNRIHSIVRPDLCLNNNMESDGIKKCTYGNYTVWNIDANFNGKVVYRTTNNRCLDSWNYKLFPSHTCVGHEYQEMQEAFHKQTRSDRYASTPAAFENNKCINIADNNTITVENCSNTDTNVNYKVFIDIDGRIHAAKKPNYCLEGFSNGIKLMPCGTSSRQKWVKKDNMNVYENVSYTDKCLANDGNNNLVLSSCQDSNQQKFRNTLTVEQNKGISYFDEALLKEFDKYLIQAPASTSN